MYCLTAEEIQCHVLCSLRQDLSPSYSPHSAPSMLHMPMSYMSTSWTRTLCTPTPYKCIFYVRSYVSRNYWQQGSCCYSSQSKHIFVNSQWHASLNTRVCIVLKFLSMPSGIRVTSDTRATTVVLSGFLTVTCKLLCKIRTSSYFFQCITE